MDLASILFLVGAATVLLAGLAPRLSPRLAARRRWILSVGITLLIVGAILGGPEFLRGFREGFHAETK